MKCPWSPDTHTETDLRFRFQVSSWFPELWRVSQLLTFGLISGNQSFDKLETCDLAWSRLMEVFGCFLMSEIPLSSPNPKPETLNPSPSTPTPKP
jgi:hypothetical protein